MSFTINRVYKLRAGVNYNPNTNTVLRFRGTVTSGATDITVINGPVFNAITSISGAGGTPTVIGTGFKDPVTGSPRIPVGSAAPLVTTGAITSTESGTFEFMLFDGDRPSYSDSPIIGFHVQSTPTAPFVFTTLQGDTVKLPITSMIAGAVYYYAIAEVISMGAPGELLGLAPAIKPNIV